MNFITTDRPAFYQQVIARLAVYGKARVAAADGDTCARDNSNDLSMGLRELQQLENPVAASVAELRAAQIIGYLVARHALGALPVPIAQLPNITITAGGVSAHSALPGVQVFGRASEGASPVGQWHLSNGMKDALTALIDPVLAPLASISGGASVRRLGGDVAVTLSWTATKRTNPITSIIVDGTVVTPTGNTQSGTVSRTANNAVTGAQTYAMSVTASALSAGATASVQYQHERFFFATATNLLDSALTDASLTATLDALLAGPGHELATSRLMTKQIDTTGGKRITLAVPVAFGTPGATKVNGVPLSAIGSRVFTYTYATGITASFFLIQATDLSSSLFTAEQL